MAQNLVIIGAGPAGEAAARAARRLTQESANGSSTQITLIEKEEAGGLCLNKGCIPSKTLLEHVRQWSQSGKKVDWNELQNIKAGVVAGIRSQLERSLKTQKINFIRGTATFENNTTLHIEGKDKSDGFSFEKAIITTGTEIFYPPPLDQFKDQLLTSDTILELRTTPKSMVIVGGGAVGLEFACLLNAAGTKVTVVELQPTILPGEDPAICSALTRSFESRGIKILTNTSLQTIVKESKGWKITLNNGDVLQSEQILACVGRVPNPKLLQIEKAAIELENRRLKINQHLQTTNPNIYAAGDATTTRLAHAAAAQAEVAATNALGGKEIFDDNLVPRCLYSWPEVASVGAWKYQLEGKNIPVKATRSFYKGSAKALAAGETEGFVQVVSDPNMNKILGAQIIGSHATELIHIFSVALKAEMTTKQLGEVMFAHPTLAEMVKEACKR